jgi:FkbM family methyltransferase
MSALQTLSFVWNHPLNAGRRPAAIGRVLRWQIASRLSPGPIALPFIENTCLVCTRGLTGATGNYYCGLHEVRDMAFVLHLLRPDDVFLDVGANVGSYTVLAAGGVGARVTSVEPVPETFMRLERNIAVNGLASRVRAVRCGLSDGAGTARFTTGLDAMNHIVAEGDTAAAVEVPVETLDTVAAEVPLLMKIDVEGHERSVLGGAARTLADPRLLAAIIEVDRTEDGGREVDEIMRAHGFSQANYDAFTRTLTDPVAAANAIYVRDRQAAQQRLSGARRYRLLNGEI